MIVSGLDDVLAGLAREAATAGSNAAKAATEAAAKVQATAKSLAPKLTGALANSITTDVTQNGAEVGPTVRYAPFVEYGTSKDSPQPFMGPAAERHEDEFAQLLSDLVGEL
jgi:HK97 gp10 family phage protein